MNLREEYKAYCKRMKQPMRKDCSTKEFINSEPISFKEFKEAYVREVKIKIY